MPRLYQNFPFPRSIFVVRLRSDHGGTPAFCEFSQSIPSSRQATPTPHRRSPMTKERVPTRALWHKATRRCRRAKGSSPAIRRGGEAGDIARVWISFQGLLHLGRETAHAFSRVGPTQRNRDPHLARNGDNRRTRALSRSPAALAPRSSTGPSHPLTSINKTGVLTTSLGYPVTTAGTIPFCGPKGHGATDRYGSAVYPCAAHASLSRSARTPLQYCSCVRNRRCSAPEVTVTWTSHRCNLGGLKQLPSEGYG
jgi:hypothetical protein